MLILSGTVQQNFGLPFPTSNDHGFSWEGVVSLNPDSAWYFPESELVIGNKERRRKKTHS